VDWDVSIRRACEALEVERSTYHYRSRRPDQAGIEARIKEICATRVRYGYRRVHVVLQRDGWRVNQKKVRRIYNELGLQLRNKTPKRRVKAKLDSSINPRGGRRGDGAAWTSADVSHSVGDMIAPKARMVVIDLGFLPTVGVTRLSVGAGRSGA
jgi:transposase InsO family protein